MLFDFYLDHDGSVVSTNRDLGLLVYNHDGLR